MRSKTAPDGGGRCPRCAVHLSVCACPWLKPHPVRTRFVVLRHVREAKKSSNSARWAALLVPRCELRAWSGRPDAELVEDLGRQGDWLLFPPERHVAFPVRPSPLPERVVVLDGTWRQVRRMLSALPALQAIPRLSVAPRPGRVVLRAAPSPSHLSTLEAMASAVALLEDEQLASALDLCHREVVARALSARGSKLPEAA